MRRHAEIAGAGFGGLVAAVALLQRGWSVRVHERTSFLRAEGFGISIHQNGLRVLQALGVLDRILEHSMQIRRRVIRNSVGRVTADLPLSRQQCRISRQHMVAVLAETAAALGGEVLTNSAVAGADPRGELILESGQRLRADLIIGADGYNSRVRDSLDLLARRTLLRSGAMRLVIPRPEVERAAEPEGYGTSFENWSGSRRLIYSPCSAHEVYIAMSCLHDDADGTAVPVRDSAWRSSFPFLEDVFDRISRFTEWDRVKWARFQVITLKQWSRGRAAVLGDAAHAMPPDLGQGGGCTMMNALALAVALSEDRELDRALSRWEARERGLTEHTQRWSRRYGAVTLWPDGVRSLAFSLSTRSTWLRRQLHRTAEHVPTGATPPAAGL